MRKKDKMTLRGKCNIKSTTALALTGLLFFIALPVSVNAEEVTATGEAILLDVPQREDGATVQAYYPGWNVEPVSSVAVRSGRLDMRPLTKTEIANLRLEAETNSTPLSYDVQPNLTAPYVAGRASAANRQSALLHLNMYRRIAGLTPVMEAEELSYEAQHGAVLLAALNELTHYPEKPADMEEDFYRIAYSATTSSNLSAGWGYRDYRMENGIDSCMRDNSGSNLTSVGHRRWFLNPQMLYVGFGEALTSHPQYATAYYFDYKVFDTSNGKTDFDFISWPSSGNFPLELVSAKLPWSISLNSDRYESPNLGDVVVEVTNPAGQVEIFSAADNDASDLSGAAKYFNVSNASAGYFPCIIFNFGGNYGEYIQPGTYGVKVTGLKSAQTGEPVSIEYRTNMFNAADYAGKPAVTDAQYEAIETFVERLYTKCLGRPSEQLGKLDWTMRLADRDISGAGAGHGFVFSDEYLNKGTEDEVFLDMLYDVYLGRTADAGGKEYWGNMLRNGVSRLFVFRGFAESEEYGRICKEYGIERGNVELTEGRDLNAGATMFVYRIYEKALGREAELVGLNDWAGAIARGEMSPETVAQSFFHSVEFLNKNYDDETYVKLLYRTFMGREYDDGGLADWTQRLSQGATRDEVMAGFSRSEEFKEIMASYGL